MAEINPKDINREIYVVELTEYELGWGSKPWDVKYFDNEPEARKWADDYNKKHNNQPTTPDWYVVADYRGKMR